MKFPQIATCLVLVLSFGLVNAQKAALTAVPSGVYFGKAEPNISDALNTEHHKTLFEALKMVDLEEILELSGPFTVFAPTNKAFTRLTTEEQQALFREGNRKKLKDVLTYHMVAGNLTASKILRALCRGKGKASFTTVQGNKIFATIQGTDIVLTDGLGNQAKITTADSGQSNGVIHQIDGVILPSGI